MNPAYFKGIFQFREYLHTQVFKHDWKRFFSISSAEDVSCISGCKNYLKQKGFPTDFSVENSSTSSCHLHTFSVRLISLKFCSTLFFFRRFIIYRKFLTLFFPLGPQDTARNSNQLPSIFYSIIQYYILLSNAIRLRVVLQLSKQLFNALMK